MNQYYAAAVNMVLSLPKEQLTTYLHMMEAISYQCLCSNVETGRNPRQTLTKLYCYLRYQMQEVHLDDETHVTIHKIAEIHT